jgi:Flp pilus assembly protein TadG
MTRRVSIPGAFRLLRDRRGATAAEFALILAPLILLTLGTINACGMLYTASALHFAVENTARWTSIATTTNGGTAPGSSAIQAHGAGVYKGIAAANFVRDGAATCGSKINGTADYNFTTGLTNSVVSLSASACYPLG